MPRDCFAYSKSLVETLRFVSVAILTHQARSWIHVHLRTCWPIQCYDFYLSQPFVLTTHLFLFLSLKSLTYCTKDGGIKAWRLDNIHVRSSHWQLDH